MSIAWMRRVKWTTYLLACLAVVGFHRLAPGPAAAAEIIYVYDDVGQLIGVIDAAGESAGYRYDEVGNLIGVVRGATGGPAITAIAPVSGAPGIAVTISGSGFGATSADNTVTFNGVRTVVTSATATRLVATVPAGAATGPVTVTTIAGSARSSAAFTVTVADLVPTALTAPATASPRQKLTASWSVANRGTGPAKAPWRDAIYLSRDSVCCAADEPVAGVDLTSALGPGQSYSRTSTGTIPLVPAGQYYLILSTDEGRAVIEADETNNRRVLPITITVPDLVPTALNAPSTWIRGQTLSVSWTVKNQGSGTASADATSNWVDQLHLATTPVCCESATLVGSVRRTAPLNAGATYSQSLSVKVPDVPPGSYYLVFTADALAFVGDGNQDNNQRAVPVTITVPDLLPTALTAPPSVTTQQPFSMSWTVKNQGNAATSSPWNDRVYLSPLPACCLGDPIIGTVTRSAALAPGGSYTVTKSFTLPNVPAGSYFLRLTVDDGLAIRETDEGNNQRAVPITVTAPDLAAASLTAPPSSRAQQVVSVAWTVSNVGSGSAKAPWTDVVYLSTDQTCCAGDTSLAVVSHTAPLAAGASYTQTKSVTIPARPPGTYYLILKTDTGGAVYEADEANNARVVPFTIAP
jgi:YD repeat-containing protein